MNRSFSCSSAESLSHTQRITERTKLSGNNQRDVIKQISNTTTKHKIRKLGSKRVKLNPKASACTRVVTIP